MTNKEHLKGLMNNIKGTIVQLAARIEFTKHQRDKADDEEKEAELQLEVDKYKEKLADIKDEHTEYLEFLQENEETITDLIEQKYEVQ